MLLPVHQCLYQKENTKRTSDEVVLVQSFLDVFPRPANLMADKGLNPYDECTARYVHLSTQEEE